MSLTEVPTTPLTSAVAAGSPSVLRAAPSRAGAAPLPLPRPGWGTREALLALDEARLALPVRVPDAEAVSALTTVVLRAGDHAVKVYPPGTDAGHLDRTAAALSGSATALLPTVPAVTTSYGVVTLVPWLPSAGPVTWPALGRLLRAFHDAHADADLPRWQPLSRLPSQVAGLREEHAAVLLEARSALLGALEEVSSQLGVGTIHGDVSPGNVVRTVRGPRLIDLDWVARAPREYDLASAARRFAAGDISRQAYAGFCRGYGADVRSWPGLPLVNRIADLDGVAFRLWDCRQHGRGLDWVSREVALWRTPL
ncbi:MAG TPA: hypothetical protein VI452_10510 [Marmoricola sp.]